jgi:hypothetical protein
VTVPDITVERAACNDMDMFNWFKQGINLVSGLGDVAPQNERDMSVMQLDRDGSELREIPCTGCQPIKFVAGDWDNESDENVIEKTTMMLDTWDIINLQGGAGAPPGVSFSISV